MNDVKSNSTYGEEYARKVHEFNRKWIEDELKKIDILIQNTSKLIDLLEPKEEKVVRKRIFIQF